jgi:uncharacterized protein (TIGR03000 family)
MIRNAFFTALLVAAGLIFLIPGAGFAGPRGGGGHSSGGYHSGGSYHYGGGYHNGGSYHPYYGGYHGGEGYHYGSGYHDSYHPYYGGYYNNWYRYRPYYGGYYGYYPYDFSDFGPVINPAPVDSGLSYQPPLSPVDGFTLNGSTPSSDQPAPASTSPAPADATSAHFTVNVPADAQLWLDNTPMTSVGAVREFVSPPLAPGWYTYSVKASWNENGHNVTQTQQLQLRAGAQVSVKFPVAPGATPAPAAAGN